MSYQSNVKPGMLERLATVPGLVTVESGERAGDREPPPAFPLCYFALAGFDRPSGLQLVEMQYEILIRVFVLFQGDGDDEEALAAFVNSVPAAFDRNLIDANGHSYATLGGRVTLAVIDRGESDPDTTGFGTYLRQYCRIITFRARVTETAALGAGL